MANETIKQAKDAVLDRITTLAEDANTNASEKIKDQLDKLHKQMNDEIYLIYEISPEEKIHIEQHFPQ